MYGQETIAADFYRPKANRKPAVIIMAHEFAGLRQFKLIQYAQKFAQAGYAVVLFDYRYWGGSTGKPRELISLKDQIEDWKTVIQYISACKWVDQRRIVLWGTGLSGGYVLNLASELKNISSLWYKCLLWMVLKLPKFIRSSNYPNFNYLVRIYGGKGWIKPRTLPVVAQQQLSFFPTSDSYQGYLSIVNPDYYWSGEVPARYFN
jgi:fermentation-respiration switch protein FrsA (DUF1100 family)